MRDHRPVLPPQIDLNADLGEGAASDAELLRCVTSANVACGAHAGDAATAAAVCRAAAELGVRVGAHPGHPDPTHMGRRPLPITPRELDVLLSSQLDWLLAHAQPEQVRHLKLHGALYHQAAGDPALATAVTEFCAQRNLALLAPPASVLQRHAESAGVPVGAEGFVDRAYTATAGGLALVARTERGAVLSPAAAAEQARRLVLHGEVRTVEGSVHAAHVDSLCIHGDGEEAVAIADAVRDALIGAGIRLRAFAE